MNKTHGATSGYKMTKEYVAYRCAKWRCSDPKNSDYKGRGIKFLFQNFTEFFNEVGPKPAGTSLDRIDNSGNYEKGNVRWSLPAQQQRNKRKYKAIENFSDEELLAEIKRRGL